MSAIDEPGLSLDSAESKVTYTIGTAPKKTPLGVTTIAHYKTDETYNTGRLIAAKPQFICYAVKGNMVRVISTSNSSRILLKEHKEPVHDLSFLAGGQGATALLITCARDGLCIIWQLVQEAVELRGEPVARIQLDAPVFFTRVVTHPSSPSLFATARSDSVINVWNSEQLIAATAERAGAPLSAASAPGLNVSLPNEPTSVAFSPDQLLAVGMRNGAVSLLNSSDGSLVHSWATHDSAVEALEWAAGGRALVTGARQNTEFVVWDALSGWVAQQSVQLTGAVQNTCALDSAAGLLFVASVKQPTLAVFHLSAKVNRFDYVCEFPVSYPILSFVSVSKPAADDRTSLHLYCLQTAAVQRFEMFEDSCLPMRLRAGGATAADAASAATPFSILPVAGITLSQLASPQKFDETKKREQEAAEAQRQRDEAERLQRAETARKQAAEQAIADQAAVAAAHAAAAAQAATAAAALAAAAASQPAAADQVAAPAVPSQETDDQRRQREETAALRIQKAYRRAHKNVPSANPPETPDSPTDAPAPLTPAPATATVTFKDDVTQVSHLAPGLLPITALSEKDEKTKRDSKKGSSGRQPRNQAAKANLLPKLKEADDNEAKHSVQSSGDEGRRSKDDEKKDKKKAQKSAQPHSASKRGSDGLDERDQKLLAAFQARLDERDRELAELVSKQVARQVQDVVLPALSATIKTQQESLRRALLQSVDEAALRGPMQAAFSTCFQQTVLPQFERAVQNMFGQMQAAFDRGLAENLARLPAAAAAQTSASGDGGSSSALQERNLQLQSLLTENLRTATSTLIHLGESLNTRVDSPAKAGKQPRERPEKNPRLPPASAAPAPTGAAPHPADALAMSVLPHTAKPSAAPSPTTAPLPQPLVPATSSPTTAAPVPAKTPLPSQLDGLLRRGQYAKAFNIALNAGELEPVVALCEHLKNPAVVFAAQPPLSSLEILSLVQQLSCSDLTRSTGPKLMWISEGLKQLDPHDADIRDELPGVLQQLSAALAQQQARDPTNTDVNVLQTSVRARLRG